MLDELVLDCTLVDPVLELVEPAVELVEVEAVVLELEALVANSAPRVPALISPRAPRTVVTRRALTRPAWRMFMASPFVGAASLGPSPW